MHSALHHGVPENQIIAVHDSSDVISAKQIERSDTARADDSTTGVTLASVPNVSDPMSVRVQNLKGIVTFESDVSITDESYDSATLKWADQTVTGNFGFYVSMKVTSTAGSYSERKSVKIPIQRNNRIFEFDLPSSWNIAANYTGSIELKAEFSGFTNAFDAMYTTNLPKASVEIKGCAAGKVTYVKSIVTACAN